MQRQSRLFRLETGLITAMVMSLFSCNGQLLGTDREEPDAAAVDMSVSPPVDMSIPPPVCYGRFCQVPHCPAGTTTALSGRVYSGNGVDPIPGATVFVPIEEVPDQPRTLSCDSCSNQPRAVAIATTAFDGSFRLSGVPEGQFPLVVRLGRFQRVVQITATACVENQVPADSGSSSIRLPRRTGELSNLDHLPRIAVSSGDWDQIECVLKRTGIDELDIYNGRDASNSSKPPSVAPLSTLLNDRNRLFGYDIVIVNCTNNQYQSLLASSVVKQNLEAYVHSGGRLYITDWAYDVVEQVPEFSPYLCFQPQTPAGPPMCMAGSERAKIADTYNYYGGASDVLDNDMARWLGQFPGVISASKQVSVYYNFIVISQVSNDSNGTSKVWVQGPHPTYGTVPMTVTFDYKNCGRVHFSTYNTEPSDAVDDNTRWPSRCKTQFTKQERLLEYLFFNVVSCVGEPPG